MVICGLLVLGLCVMAIDLSDYISAITVETTYLPPIVIEDPFAKGPPNPVMERLKPKITLHSQVIDAIVSKPYGDPGPSQWPMIKLGLIVASVLASYLVYDKYIR